MKYIALFLLFFSANCLAQEANTFGSTGGPSIVITPPPAQSIKPCESGQCGFGKKQHRKRRSFGSRRKKSLSSFGKGGNNRRSKSINGGGKSNRRSRHRR